MGWLSVFPEMWLFATRAADSEFGLRLAASLADLKASRAYVDLQVKHFSLSMVCRDGEISETDPIGVDAMEGLFIICGSLAIAAVLVALLQRLLHEGACTGRRRRKT